MTSTTLTRSSATPFAPVPSSVRAGDYIFASSIYPVDASGHAVGTDERLGEVGPSAIAVQTRACMESLSEVLREQGSSLDNLLKVSVHLTDAADFYEFKLVWREYFPDSPPVRTAVEVGDTLPFRGLRLSIDATALAGDSDVKRETLHDPEGSDPLEVEGCPLAIRAGNLVFCSGLTASDFETGIAVGKAPGFPNYGSDATKQAEYVFDRLNRVLGTVNTSLQNAVEAYLYEPDLSTFNDIDTVWRQYMQPPPCRSSMGMKGLLVPGACFIADLTVLIPEGGSAKEESREGIDYHPVSLRNVNFTPTLKAGDWLFMAGKTAGDMKTVHAAPSGLPHHFSDIEVQTTHILDKFVAPMKANGTSWSDCPHVRVWLVEPQRDYRGFMRAWQDYFPDPANAPTLAYVPSTATMYPGPLIEIDPTCVIK